MESGELAEVSRRIRCVQQQLRRRRVQEDAQQGFVSPKMASSAIMVYMFSGHDLDMAAQFLLVKLRLAEDCMEDMRCTLERVYTQEPTPQIVDLMNDRCLLTRSMRVMTAACTFILQRRLYTWLCQQNCKHGVAPQQTANDSTCACAGAFRLPAGSASLCCGPLAKLCAAATEVAAPIPTSMGGSFGDAEIYFKFVSPGHAGEGRASCKSRNCLFGPQTKDIRAMTPLLVVVFRLLKW